MGAARRDDRHARTAARGYFHHQVSRARLRQIYGGPVPAATPAPAASTAAERASFSFNFELPSERASAPGATSMVSEADEDDDADLDPVPAADGRREIKWVKLREDISEEQYAEIKKLGIKAVTGDRGYRRLYPNHQLAAHLIGYVNREERPATGIEAYADFYLRGQNGWSVGERDGRGRELAQFRTREVPHADGYSVVLSLDSNVQDVIEQELDYIAKKFQPIKATIIVSDPRTGFILGMANYPTFDLNAYNKVPKDELARMKNVAVADVYEPGSVFKIVAASAALEERLVTADRTFNCTLDKIDYKGRTLKLPADEHHWTHDLSVAEIISHSSNRGAAQLGMLLGEERFYRYARGFGFGQTLGFPIGDESRGIFLPPEKWNLVDITRIPMGHTIAATALQMHQAMSTIANGGVLLRPQIIQEIKDASGERVFNYTPTPIGRAVSERTARTMAALLMGVATKEGTAPEAAIPGFDVAGKTGTTQKIIDGQYSEKHHVASFVGFFPAGAPQVAISVIVDDADAHAPNGVAYGAKVAAPSFKSIGEKLIPILDIKSANYAARPPLVAANEGGRR
jgi:cell division protein FtsI (penicillin-binding protein 3)